MRWLWKHPTVEVEPADVTFSFVLIDVPAVGVAVFGDSAFVVTPPALRDVFAVRQHDVGPAILRRRLNRQPRPSLQRIRCLGQLGGDVPRNDVKDFVAVLTARRQPT